MATHRFVIEGQAYVVTVGPRRGNHVQVTVNGRTYTVELTASSAAASVTAGAGASSPAPATVPPARPVPSAGARDSGRPPTTSPPVGRSSKRTPTTRALETTPGTVRAPIAGVVLHVAVEIGQAVAEGTVLLVLEAMKMENEIVAPIGGVVEKVLVSAQQRVRPGEVLVQIVES